MAKESGVPPAFRLKHAAWSDSSYLPFVLLNVAVVVWVSDPLVPLTVKP